MAQDPVCGMKINENEAVAKEEYRGKVYYFCSLSCRDAFRKDPDKHAKSGDSAPGHSH